MEVSSIDVGQILPDNPPKFVFFKPRQTLYKVLSSCKIKHSTTNLWLDGLVYQEVDKPNSQVYCRQLDKFGDKWEIYYS